MSETEQQTYYIKDPSYLAGSNKKVLDVYEVLRYEGEDPYFWLFWVKKVSQFVDGEEYNIEGAHERLMPHKKKRAVSYERGRTEYTQNEPPAYLEDLKERKERADEAARQKNAEGKQKMKEALQARQINI